MKLSVSDEKMKELMKEAIVELIQEKNDLLFAVILEVIEEIGLVKAIKEGEKGENVDRETLFRVLDS